MRQLYELYCDDEIVSPLVTQLPWSHHLTIMGQARLVEAWEFHIRALSPAMIAEYETMLPDKELLRAKLHEFYQLLAPPEDGEEKEEAERKAIVAPLARRLKKRRRR